jgi:hypothetical protein
MKRLTFLTLTLFYINGFSQQYSKCWKDLNYADGTLVDHRLDIFIPKTENPRYPVVPYCQSEILFQALQKSKVPSKFISVPGEDMALERMEKSIYSDDRFFGIESENIS